MVADTRLIVPYAPRRVFAPFHLRKQRFAIGVAHRRCGKTVACVNDLIRRAGQNQRTGAAPGRYAYVAPFLNQAKDTAWSYLKHYAAPLLMKPPNEGELYVELEPNAARVRIYGADNADRLRGGYLDHVILDEYADMAPSIWPLIIRPMLSDYKGGATFIGTPKGRNGFYDLYEAAAGDPNWFRFFLPASGTAIIAEDELRAAARDMTPEEYAQEYECSFDAAIKGAYYGREIADAERAGRIGAVPIAEGFAVHSAWDLGKGQNMPVWCFQILGSEIRIVDFIEDYEATIERMAATLTDRGYRGTDFVPHDAKAPELSTGRTRVETLVRCGRNPKVVTEHKVEDGINAARLTFPRVWFDADKCRAGIEALRQYRADYDEKKKTFLDHPRHDWASHPADAFRYLAMAWREQEKPVDNSVQRPAGKAMSDMTYNDLHDLDDDMPRREARI
jgi:hypothetical protein